jgi:hypothetical protein
MVAAAKRCVGRYALPLLRSVSSLWEAFRYGKLVFYTRVGKNLPAVACRTGE